MADSMALCRFCKAYFPFGTAKLRPPGNTLVCPKCGSPEFDHEYVGGPKLPRPPEAEPSDK